MSQRFCINRQRRRQPTKNQCFPIFSEEDKDLRREMWHCMSSGYAVSCNVFAHRIVLERKLGRKLRKGEWSDHRNHNKMDCRRRNLIVCTPRQNCQSRNLMSHNTSGFRGVSFHRQYGKWEAYVIVDDKKINGGFFSSAEEAAARSAQLRKRHNFYGE